MSDQPLTEDELEALDDPVATARAVVSLRRQYEDMAHRNLQLGERVANLENALRAARTELERWGWGDMHYGDTGRQEQEVVDALAAIDRALGEP